MFSTFLCGSSEDKGLGIAVDASGCAYVTGYAKSDDFPTRNPIQGVRKGTSDAFMTKLNATGDALLYSTYLGGSGSDYSRSIAVDKAGSAYITGNTDSTDFPTCNPFQGAPRGYADAFVTKIREPARDLSPIISNLLLD